METKESQVDPNDFFVDEEVIRKVSPELSVVDTQEHELKCICERHLIRKKSNKAYAIIPIKQDGHIINVVKLPLYKMDKEPKKNFLRYTKYRIVPNNPNHYCHYTMPVWHFNQSEILSSVTCKEFENENFGSRSDAACQTEEQMSDGPVIPERPEIIQFEHRDSLSVKEPRKYSEEPRKYSEEPRKYSEEPRKYSEEPGKYSEEPEPIQIEHRDSLTVKEPRKFRRQSFEARQQSRPTKWHSLFVNDKSYTRKKSDG